MQTLVYAPPSNVGNIPRESRFRIRLHVDPAACAQLVGHASGLSRRKLRHAATEVHVLSVKKRGSTGLKTHLSSE